jgi:hypothetical protein
MRKYLAKILLKRREYWEYKREMGIPVQKVILKEWKGGMPVQERIQEYRREYILGVGKRGMT